jgi:hypothetical protein
VGPVPGTFFENFEDGTLDRWREGPENAGAQIVDTVAADGTSRSLEVAGVSDFGGPNVSFEPFQPSYVSWWLRVGQTGAYGSSIALSADDAAVYRPVQTWVANDGFWFAGGITVVGGTPVVNTWYHLEMEIDWTARTFTGYVDGVNIGEGTLLGDDTAITRFDVFNSAIEPSYFDEIELRP